MSAEDRDPLLTIAAAALYAQVSGNVIRKCIHLPEADPKKLQAVMHFGKLKCRLSWLDEWIERTSEVAA